MGYHRSVSGYEVIVIGAGQAGLAVGYHLARQERHYTILDAASEPAAAWRARWDSLRLFTPARYDILPGLPFPADPAHHPSRDEVVAYLTDYARHFALPVELDSRAHALRAADDGFELELAGRRLHASQVVVATGPFQVPRRPAFADDVTVPHLHSADYRSPNDLPDGRILVVGGGNTGFQLAQELAATHDVHLAVGPRQTPLPQRVLGRDIFDVLHHSGVMRVTADSPLGRRLRDRDVLIGCGPRSARRTGVTLHPRAVAADQATVHFADDTTLNFDAVLWATGFTRDHSWIDAAAHPYFIGLPWQRTRRSALLGWVQHDAARVVSAVQRGPASARRALPCTLRISTGSSPAGRTSAARACRTRRPRRRQREVVLAEDHPQLARTARTATRSPRGSAARARAPAGSPPSRPACRSSRWVSGTDDAAVARAWLEPDARVADAGAPTSSSSGTW